IRSRYWRMATLASGAGDSAASLAGVARAAKPAAHRNPCFARNPGSLGSCLGHTTRLANSLTILDHDLAERLDHVVAEHPKENEAAEAAPFVLRFRKRDCPLSLRRTPPRAVC